MNNLIQGMIAKFALIGTTGILALSGTQQFNPSEINEPIKPLQVFEKKFETINWSEKGQHKYEPTHKQKTWVAVLHWCESRGDVNAINPNDLDNTPSWGAYQFKPNTLKGYAVKYGLLPDNLETEDYINWSFDYNFMTELVYRMLNDKDVKWQNEFPWCVKKFGLPPKNG